MLLDLKNIHSMSLRVAGKEPQVRMIDVQMMCFKQEFKWAADTVNTLLWFIINQANSW